MPRKFGGRFCIPGISFRNNERWPLGGIVIDPVKPVGCPSNDNKSNRRFAVRLAVLATATPVRSDWDASSSAKIRNDVAFPVVATPVWVTVVPFVVKVKSDDTTGAGLP